MLTKKKKRKMSFKQFDKIARKTPSVVLGMAIADAERLQKQKGFVLNMGTWLEKKQNGKCVVCLAGSCMVHTLGIKPQHIDDEYTPSDAGKASEALVAINKFREGKIAIGLNELGIHDWQSRGLPATIPMDSDFDTKASFVTAKKVKAILEAFGL